MWRQTAPRPARPAGEEGYTGRKIRRYLRRRGIGTVNPRLSNGPRRAVRFNQLAYRARNRGERPIKRLKPFRAVANRYDNFIINPLCL